MYAMNLILPLFRPISCCNQLAVNSEKCEAAQNPSIKPASVAILIIKPWENPRMAKYKRKTARIISKVDMKVISVEFYLITQ